MRRLLPVVLLSIAVALGCTDNEPTDPISFATQVGAIVVPSDSGAASPYIPAGRIYVYVVDAGGDTVGVQDANSRGTSVQVLVTVDVPESSKGQPVDVFGEVRNGDTTLMWSPAFQAVGNGPEIIVELFDIPPPAVRATPPAPGR